MFRDLIVAAAEPTPLTGETDHQERRRTPMSARTDPSRSQKTTMPGNEQTEQESYIDRQTRDTRNDLIAKQVVQSLGSPADLLKVQVRPLGRDRYRVNVFVGKYGAPARIADSFFLTADDEGKILASSPEIARLY
jgi:hypothetical protein